MPTVISPFEAKLKRVFLRIVAARWLIIVAYGLLLPPSVYFALKVQQDNSLDRLVVQSDPTYTANKRFEGVFGHGEYVLVLVEANDPFALDVLKRFDELENAVGKVPHVTANSALSVFKRAKGGFDASPAAAERFKQFVSGTELFKKQGLVAAHMLALPLFLDVQTTEERTAVIDGIDHALRALREIAGAVHRRPQGRPALRQHLPRQRHAHVRVQIFPAVHAVRHRPQLGRSIARSARCAPSCSRSASAPRMTVGFVGVTGGTFTIVSSLVPMTILITCTATLVYLHSRFVEVPDEGVDLDEHQAIALANKFVAATASIFATAVGFAALAVSRDPPHPRARPVGRRGPRAHLDHRVHALPGAAEGAATRRPSSSARPPASGS